MKKTLLKLVVTTLSSATLLSGIVTTASAEEVIATIGETQITKDQFYEAMKNLSGEVTLRTMILEEVMKNNVENPEALKQAAEEEVQAQIEEVGGEEAFNQLLAYQQLGTIDEYIYQVFIRNMFQDVVEQQIDMSDEAIQAFYEEGYEPTMEAQHILVETEEEAQAVLDRLEAGEEFDAIAQEVSLDSTAANGGLLGPFTKGQMVPEFEEAVLSGTNGEVISEPVQTQHGYHIIKVLNNGEKQPLEEVKEEVIDQYKLSKFADSTFAYSVIGQLIEDTGLEVHDEDLKHVVDDLLDLANNPTDELEVPSVEDTENTEEETDQEEATE